MPLLLARMVITLVFFSSSSSSFLYVYAWDRLSSSSSCSFSRRHLCFTNVSLSLYLSSSYSSYFSDVRVVLCILYFYYLFASQACPLRFIDVSSKEEYVVCHVSGISASYPGCMAWRCRVRSGKNANNVVFIIGSASKRMPKAANFVSIFVLVFSFFFSSLLTFSLFFFHMLRVFLDQLLFILIS